MRRSYALPCLPPSEVVLTPLPVRRLLHGPGRCVLRLAERIRDLTGSSSPITFVDRPVDDPGVRRPDCSLAERELGWRPEIGYVDGLTRTIKWFADQPGVA